MGLEVIEDEEAEEKEDEEVQHIIAQGDEIKRKIKEVR